MIPKKIKKLSSYIADMQAGGRLVFSRRHAEQALGILRRPFLDMAERLQKKGSLIHPRRGFYVIVPPQFMSWGSPPPAWFIDDLMHQEACPYYVGLLKAAELHEAAHQAVMEFQVITQKRMPKLRTGRSAIAFYYSKKIAALESGIEERKTDTGKMRISSVELTALDLLRYPRAAGGLDNIATVLADLGPKLDGNRLALLASVFERSVRQRLGYLLTRAGHTRTAEMLLPGLAPTLWVELDPLTANDTEFSPDPIDRDPRWRVIVRRMPEVDT